MIQKLVALSRSGVRRARSEDAVIPIWSGLVTPTITWAKWQIEGIAGRAVPLFADRRGLLTFAAEHVRARGLWLEFGVWQGESLRTIAGLTPGPVYGFDSFQGLPEWWTAGMPAGRFSTRGQLPSVPRNTELVVGWFSDTLPPFLERHVGAVAFLHVDSDLYSSASTVLRLVEGRLVPGSVIVFDEFVGIMPDDEARAFREFRRANRTPFRYLGCTSEGSVAVALGPVPDATG